MSRVAAIYAAITALLENKHAVAIKGQALRLSPEDLFPLVAHLCTQAQRLDRQIVAAGVGLNR